MPQTRLTRAAKDRLAAELDDLTTRGRVDIAKKIEDARALGDLSENGDYHAAKDAQAHMESRIRQIQATLRDAEVVDALGGDVVEPGVIVTLSIDGDPDEQFVFGDLAEQRDDLVVISPGSPLGQAIAGHKAGDTTDYELPNGARLPVTIVAIAE